MKILIYLLIISISLPIIVSSEDDIEFINSSHAEEVSTKIYEIINVNLDSTENEVFIFTNLSEIEFEIDLKEEFHVWDYKEYIDEKIIKFDVRPEVADPFGDKGYYFNSNINLSGLKKSNHLIKISYKSDNINEIVDREWYPFDKYEILGIDRSIDDNIYRIAKISFPETDINPKLLVNSDIKTDNCGDATFSQELIKDDFTYITTGTAVSEMDVTTFNVYIAEVISENEIRKVVECKLTHEVTEDSNIILERSWFPSKILFTFMLILIIFLSLYYWKKDLIFLDKIYHTYIIIIIPFILSEYTVSILPPFRPLTFTLFDGLFFLPIIILSILEDLKKFKNKNNSHYKFI
ncbi:hypothetical protein HYX15_01625 [Candidatus Woesearchaeota archaeon]|nr:hypothetical protein [Candidatus Woesearchaeota archaeon]